MVRRDAFKSEVSVMAVGASNLAAVYGSADRLAACAVRKELAAQTGSPLTRECTPKHAEWAMKILSCYGPGIGYLMTSIEQACSDGVACCQAQ